MEVCGQHQVPDILLPRKTASTYFTESWVAPRAVWSGKKISPPPGFDRRNVEAVASCYTDWATPANINIKYREIN